MSTSLCDVMSEEMTAFVITHCRTSSLAVRKKFVHPAPHVLIVPYSIVLYFMYLCMNTHVCAYAHAVYFGIDECGTTYLLDNH